MSEMMDRLIEIVKSSLMKHIDKSCKLAENIADDLLSKGVIVPPCKVGDTVYRLKKRYGVWCILPREVVSLTYRLDHLYRVVWEVFSTETDALGKSVFLTREEAEKALERSENGTK